MASKLRSKNVSVGVIFDAEMGFLLFRNPNWDQFAFCMKKPSGHDDLGEVALVALSEDSPLEFPEATARPLCTVGAFGESGSVQEDTYYEYHVFELEPGDVRQGEAANPEAKFFEYGKLMESSEVSWSTKEIARSIMEKQESALACVARTMEETTQFLMIYKPGYGYFFPSVRRKQNESSEELAVTAVRLDAAYDGELDAAWYQEVSDVHPSERFGSSTREFTFQVCRVDVTGVDLTSPDNPFAASLNGLQDAKRGSNETLGNRGYWDWFTVEELGQEADVSPTVSTVLSTAVACVEKV